MNSTPPKTSGSNSTDDLAITCDFCGVKSAKVTRLTDVPCQFDHDQFCDDKDCYDLYYNYVYFDDNSKGIPYSISTNMTNRVCDFCGSKKDVVQFNSIRDSTTKAPRGRKAKDLHRHFCREKPCFKNYSNFIFARDLSKGLPYSVEATIPQKDCIGPKPDYQCSYCGKQNRRVIYNPWTEDSLKFKTFCRNKTCYDNFYTFCTLKIPKTPFAFEHKSNSCLPKLATAQKKKRSTPKKTATKPSTPKKIATKRLPKKVIKKA